MGFSLVSFKQSTGLFEFPSGTVPFRIPSFYRKDPKAHRFTRTFRSFDGDDGIRTHDPLLAGQVLSQLSYTPIWFAVALFFGFNDHTVCDSLRSFEETRCTLNCTSSFHSLYSVRVTH